MPRFVDAQLADFWRANPSSHDHKSPAPSHHWFHYTDVPVLGAVQHDERLTIVERHLGLVPSNEAQAEAARARVEEIAALVAGQVNLAGLLDIARAAPPAPVAMPGRFAPRSLEAAEPSEGRRCMRKSGTLKAGPSKPVSIQ